MLLLRSRCTVDFKERATPFRSVWNKKFPILGMEMDKMTPMRKRVMLSSMSVKPCRNSRGAENSSQRGFAPEIVLFILSHGNFEPFSLAIQLLFHKVAPERTTFKSLKPRKRNAWRAGAPWNEKKSQGEFHD
jgi:hypothetical protein